MVNEKNLALMDDIMGIITQADEWQEIQMQDPMIADARNCWKTAFKRAKAFLPEEIYMELEAQAEAIRAELKADLESKGEDEHNTGSFVIRWKEIISRRLDGKALKAALPDVFAAYSRESTSRRFTIA